MTPINFKMNWERSLKAIALLVIGCFNFPDSINCQQFNSQSTQSLRPAQPLGLKGIHDPERQALTLIWEPVTRRADGGLLTEKAGYNVYRRFHPRGEGLKINSYLLSIPLFADRMDGRIAYYSVRAVDSHGNESPDSFLIDSSADLNTHVLAQDGHTSIIIPGRVSDLFRAEHNRYKVPLTLQFTEEPAPGVEGVVRSLHFKFVRGDTQEAVSDLAFSLPEAIISIGYNLVNGQVATGAPGSQTSGASPSQGATPDQLCLYWNNGVKWIKLGGTQDSAAQAITVRSSQLGHYQLRIAPKAAALALNKNNVFPSLFTPNGDGSNDRVYFVLENPANAGVSGRVYDLSGRFVASLVTPAQLGGSGATFEWSGIDEKGSVVPSGLYMYRIEGEGKTITGTIAVAR